MHDDGAVVGSSLGPGRNRVFLRSNPNLSDHTVSVELQLTGMDVSSPFPEYGLYSAYSDAKNNFSVWLNPELRAIVTAGISGGVDQGRQACPVPDGYDVAAPHRLDVRKEGRPFSVSLDGATATGPCNDRQFEVPNGQIGLVTSDTSAAYRNIRVIPLRPLFTTTSVVNSATYAANGVAPGEIVSIFGSGLGPLDGIVPNNLAGDPPRLPDSIGGVQVLFDGNLRRCSMSRKASSTCKRHKRLPATRE